MFNELTLLLHIALLIVIYAFLFLVVRVVARDLSLAKKATEEKLPRITVLKGGPDGKVDYPLVDQILIGRAPDCDIVLEDSFASAHHARVYIANAGFWLEDLKSTNGTTMGIRKIKEPVRLTRGSKFSIGQCVFQFDE